MASSIVNRQSAAEVALLTGGGDRPYVYGLASALMAKGIHLDLIGSNELDFPEFHNKPGLNFLNLRGDQRPDVGFAGKTRRVLLYYARLIRYAAHAKPTIFHILWNNKFEFLDRTLLTLYYRLLGRKIALTLHNVNACIRDGNDTFLNRLTLRIQYQLSDRIFVHTEKMKREIIDGFGVKGTRVTVIPFGINNAVPHTPLTRGDARKRLGLGDREKAVLFFGNIAPYKGLEYLIAAFRKLPEAGDGYRLIIAGTVKNCALYWSTIEASIREDVKQGRILPRIGFIPDEETEIYFKAADVFVLPYRHVYESGVLYLGYSFGLPVLAADVGSLKDEVMDGKTGFVFRPEDPAELAQVIQRYFASDLYAELDGRRPQIQGWARGCHSWDTVSEMTVKAYAGLVNRGEAVGKRELVPRPPFPRRGIRNPLPLDREKEYGQGEAEEVH